MCLKSNNLLSILEITDRSGLVHQFFNSLPFVTSRKFIVCQRFLNSTRLQKTSKNKNNKKLYKYKCTIFVTLSLANIQLRTKLFLLLLLFMLLVTFVLNPLHTLYQPWTFVSLNLCFDLVCFSFTFPRLWPGQYGATQPNN